jgi:type IV pilus assembly protein PilB
VERRRPQDGQISLEVEGHSVDIRVSTTAVIEGEKVVLRLLDKSRQLFRLGELGMPEDMVQRYSTVLRAPYGMVICAGPTGSGKTTTLYGSLTHINSPERNVMTIEDPVEYVFPRVNQIQINEQAGLSFATGLKSITFSKPPVKRGFIVLTRVFCPKRASETSMMSGTTCCTRGTRWRSSRLQAWTSACLTARWATPR